MENRIDRLTEATLKIFSTSPADERRSAAGTVPFPVEIAVSLVPGAGGYFVYFNEEVLGHWRSIMLAQAQVDRYRQMLRYAYLDGVTRSAAIASGLCEKAGQRELGKQIADLLLAGVSL